MSENDGKRAFSIDIPQSLVDEAAEAVGKRGASDEPAGAGGEAAPGELERLRAELDLAQRMGREEFEKRKEEHERFLRASADLENYRKRAQREKEEVQKFGAERLLRDLFPVVDNLDRALAAAPEGDPLAGGVRLVLKTLEDALAKHGVKSFHAVGQPFDPKVHEAIMTAPSADRPPGTVLFQHGRGFTLNDRLVRPALVGVAAAPEGGAGSAGGDGAGGGEAG